MNARTQSYQRYGMHAIRDLDEKQAWLNHLQGRPVALRDLPTNGDRCTKNTIGGVTCGFRILIDGTCPNAAEHGETVIEVTDAMVDAFARAYWGPAHVRSVAGSAEHIRAALAAALTAQEASDE